MILFRARPGASYPLPRALPRLPPEGLPVAALGGVNVNWIGGPEVGSENAETFHLPHPVGAGQEIGHVETSDLVEFFLTGGAHGPQLAVIGVGGVGEDGDGLAGLGIAAESPAASGFGQRREQNHGFLGPGEVEDNVTAGV